MAKLDHCYLLWYIKLTDRFISSQFTSIWNPAKWWKINFFFQGCLEYFDHCTLYNIIDISCFCPSFLISDVELCKLSIKVNHSQGISLYIIQFTELTVLYPIYFLIHYTIHWINRILSNILPYTLYTIHWINRIISNF